MREAFDESGAGSVRAARRRRASATAPAERGAMLRVESVTRLPLGRRVAASSPEAAAFVSRA